MIYTDLEKDILFEVKEMNELERYHVVIQSLHDDLNRIIKRVEDSVAVNAPVPNNKLLGDLRELKVKVEEIME